MHHLQLVLDRFGRLEHGLQQSDIDREDRMNWESAQRLMFPCVRECLGKINKGDGVDRENVAGTILYLRMCWRFVEIYLSTAASLLERVTYASCVVNFLRIWRLWVHKTGHLTLKENFVSRETFQDISLACHHAVLVIKATRDFAPSHPVCLRRTGTDVCEDYFSANGSFILNKHNFTITDMYRNLGHMFRLQEILSDQEGPEYEHAAKRCGENIWYKGHPHPPEVPPSLFDFPTDVQMVEAWDKGLLLAQVELQEAGVNPANDDLLDPANRWFFQPHLLTGVTDAQLDADGFYVDVDDQQANDVQMHYVHYRELGNGDDLNAHPILDNSDAFEVRAHLSQVAEDINERQEDQNDTTGNGQQQVVNTLIVPGHGAVHKSTLVAKLNSCPEGKLTWDRSVRVRYGKGSQMTPISHDREDQEQVGLFDDVAVYIKDRGKPAEWRLGRVIRMRNREKSTVEYLHPVNINATVKYPKLYLLIKMYSKDKDIFLYHDSTQPVEYNLSSVIKKVTLTLTGDEYYLDRDDQISLNEFITNISCSKTSTVKKKRMDRNQESAASGEGLVFIDVAPLPSTADGLRKSNRKRRLRLFLNE